MTKLDSALESGLSVFDRRRLFSSRAIWAYAFAGLAIVAATMSGLWEYSGYLVDEGAGIRYLVVLVAAVYGVVLGWMVFPRIGNLRDA
jgi:hypothetical protein